MNRSSLLAGVVAVLLFGRFASAQAPAEAAKQTSAREHFQAGVARAQAGELDAAVAEFEVAYAAQPHYSVLYNIAQAQAGLGRTALAIASFERYLQEGATDIADGRRKEVQTFLDSARKRVGAVRIVPTGSEPLRIWFDGTELSAETLVQPIAVNVGKHQVLYWAAEGGSPTVLEVHVASAKTAEAKLAPPLRPLPSAEPLAAKTRLPINARSTLRVRTNLANARVSVDGMEVAQPVVLPSGPHNLRVDASGFTSHVRRIQLEPGKILDYDVTLNPTPEALDRARKQRALGYVLGGSGIALMATAGGLALWNAQRYDAWDAGPRTDTQRVASLQRVDDIAFGCLFAGVAFVAGGIWGFVSDP